MSYRLKELANRLSLNAHGDAEITSVAAIDDAGSNDITFVSSKSYLKHLADCKAGAVILKPEWQSQTHLPVLLADNPYYSYAQVCHLLYPDEYTKTPYIAATAVVDPTAKVGEDAVISERVYIGANVTIGDKAYLAPGVVIQEGVTIGDNARIHSNVVVQPNCHVGHRVIFHPGAVIGSDGFGLAPNKGEWLKIPQVGRVVIGDDVEIGANTTIDRGANRDTVIENGVKLDNLIQVAHNVHIGAHTAIAAKVGIAGSANIGKNCTIGGAAVVLGHLFVADHVHIHAQSMVTNDITEAGEYASGTPLEPVSSWRKNRARFKQLDDMARKLKQLLKK